VPAGYAIAEIISIILCIGLVFIKMDALYESIFFTAFVSYILIYMVTLIRDLDDPFEHYAGEHGGDDEVSLKPLLDLQKRLAKALPTTERAESIIGQG
jgi:predicted membrane chloride channel (bestrophin family)